MIGFGGTGTVAIAGWTGTAATDVVEMIGFGWTGTVAIAGWTGTVAIDE